MKRYILHTALLLVLTILAAGCGDVGGSGQCGGAASAGTCIRVDSIVPQSITERLTSDVDVVANTCVDSAGTVTGTEPFGDHVASITFSNSPLPGANIETDVTLTSFSILYSLNECQSGACPDIDFSTNDPGTTIFIPQGGTVTVAGLPFFPLRKVIEFRDAGGPTDEYPSYTAKYIFKGTNTFGQSVSVEAYSEFTLGDFNNCAS